MTLRYRQILQALFASYPESELNIVMDDMESLDTDAPSLELIQAMMEDIVKVAGVRLFLLSSTLPKLSIQKFQDQKKDTYSNQP